MSERPIQRSQGPDLDSLALSETELAILERARLDALDETERVEFSDGPIVSLARMLASSPFYDPDATAAQLGELQAQFYRLKDDTLDAVSDDATLIALSRAFEAAAGDLTLTYDLAFEELHRQDAGGPTDPETVASTSFGSSLPAWAAYDRLVSADYVVSQAGDAALARLESLDADELRESFERGLRGIEEKVSRAHDLWRQACEGAPPFASRALEDTLASIGQGFDAYDPRLLAQEFPADIDYQLAHPISEELTGIDYVAAWLHRLCVEDDLLSHLGERTCRRMLDAGLPEWHEQVANVCELVIWGLLDEAAGPGAAAHALVQAGEHLSASLLLEDEAAAYLDGIAREMALRRVLAQGSERVGA